MPHLAGDIAKHLLETGWQTLRAANRSFVTDCDLKRQKIVDAILNLGRGLCIETTAEGIETPAQDGL
ncbi:EAL domain-containing protein [Phyllobacterium endophyticum]|nr:EAL domain-containing protein [Phyllobacterium endophyticum]